MGDVLMFIAYFFLGRYRYSKVISTKSANDEVRTACYASGGASLHCELPRRHPLLLGVHELYIPWASGCVADTKSTGLFQN